MAKKTVAAKKKTNKKSPQKKLSRVDSPKGKSKAWTKQTKTISASRTPKVAGEKLAGKRIFRTDAEARLTFLEEKLNQHDAELIIINGIQRGLASKLELQAIVDLVGDKLRQVLKTDEIGIRLYDEQTDTVHYLYEFEHGNRLTIPPMKPSAMFRKMKKDHLPVFGKTLEISKYYDLVNVPGTEISKSLANVPIISRDKVIGGISVENYERDDAFNELNIRLMQTIAASMGVALENAWLFDEFNDCSRRLNSAMRNLPLSTASKVRWRLNLTFKQFTMRSAKRSAGFFQKPT